MKLDSEGDGEGSHLQEGNWWISMASEFSVYEEYSSVFAGSQHSWSFFILTYELL